VSALTLWTMEQPEAVVPAGVAILVLINAITRSKRR
jgi:hypothetical protein